MNYIKLMFQRQIVYYPITPFLILLQHVESKPLEAMDKTDLLLLRSACSYYSQMNEHIAMVSKLRVFVEGRTSKLEKRAINKLVNMTAQDARPTLHHGLYEQEGYRPQTVGLSTPQLDEAEPSLFDHSFDWITWDLQLERGGFDFWMSEDQPN